jgi:hypothetical protein
MVCFIPAIQLTSVANVAVINAVVPFVAAALAWIWLWEVPLALARTLLASLLALCGVVIIVGSPETGSDIRGLCLAGAMVLAMAALTVTLRQYKHTPMVLAAGTDLSVRDVLVFAAFGFLQVGLGLTLFVLGSRLLRSAQAALIATLESPLMPF